MSIKMGTKKNLWDFHGNEFGRTTFLWKPWLFSVAILKRVHIFLNISPVNVPTQNMISPLELVFSEQNIMGLLCDL
jgi:hypothetical protein